MFFIGGIQGFAQNLDTENPGDLAEEPVEGNKEKMKQSINVAKFELEILLTSKRELEWEYARKKKKVTAEIERGDEEIEGPEAIKEMERILSKLEITDEMNDDEIVAHVLELVEVSPKDVKKLELEVKCLNGKKIKIKQKAK